MSADSAKPWRHRRARPTWVRYLSQVVAILVILPLTKVFARRWPRFMSRKLTQFLSQFPQDYVPTAHDVLICSYFKSGTNWTMQMAVQIAFRGRAEFEHIHDLVPWPDVDARAKFTVPLDDHEPQRASPTGLRVIKTHLALALVPYSSAARYICVVRDPKDVFVSSYHFTRSMVGASLMPSVAAWLDAFLSPDTPIGSWAEHLASYWRVRDRANVLFLTYETMRADLAGTLDKIAAFMGVALTSEERIAALERSTFAHMKMIGHKFDSPGAPWASTQGTMMRRGERGASGELLSAEEQRRIDDYWRAELERIGCDFPYDAAFGATSHGGVNAPTLEGAAALVVSAALPQ
jgi:hypothetical protein